MNAVNVEVNNRENVDISTASDVLPTRDLEDNSIFTFLFILSSIVFPLCFLCAVAYCFRDKVDKCIDGVVQYLSARGGGSLRTSRVIYKDPCSLKGMQGGNRGNRKDRLTQSVRDHTRNIMIKSKEVLGGIYRHRQLDDNVDDKDFDVESLDSNYNIKITESNCEIFAKYGVDRTRMKMNPTPMSSILPGVKERSVFKSDSSSNDEGDFDVAGRFVKGDYDFKKCDDNNTESGQFMNCKSLISKVKRSTNDHGYRSDKVHTKTRENPNSKRMGSYNLDCRVANDKFELSKKPCVNNMPIQDEFDYKFDYRRSGGDDKQMNKLPMYVTKPISKVDGSTKYLDYRYDDEHNYSKGSHFLKSHGLTKDLDLRSNEGQMMDQNKAAKVLNKSNVGLGRELEGHKENRNLIIKSVKPYSNSVPMFIMSNIPIHYSNMSNLRKDGQSCSLPDMYLPSGGAEIQEKSAQAITVNLRGNHNPEDCREYLNLPKISVSLSGFGGNNESLANLPLTTKVLVERLREAEMGIEPNQAKSAFKSNDKLYLDTYDFSELYARSFGVDKSASQTFVTKSVRENNEGLGMRKLIQAMPERPTLCYPTGKNNVYMEMSDTSVRSSPVSCRVDYIMENQQNWMGDSTEELDPNHFSITHGLNYHKSSCVEINPFLVHNKKACLDIQDVKSEVANFEVGRIERKMIPLIMEGTTEDQQTARNDLTRKMEFGGKLEICNLQPFRSCDEYSEMNVVEDSPTMYSAACRTKNLDMKATSGCLTPNPHSNSNYDHCVENGNFALPSKSTKQNKDIFTTYYSQNETSLNSIPSFVSFDKTDRYNHPKCTESNDLAEENNTFESFDNFNSCFIDDGVVRSKRPLAQERKTYRNMVKGNSSFEVIAKEGMQESSRCRQAVIGDSDMCLKTPSHGF